MARGPIYKNDYRPQFSGHETFPLRYGWLKKAYDRVSETESEPNNKALCWGDDAIARFGVGKNMVSAIRHWATASKIIEEVSPTGSVATTELGRILFGADGLDPYMENPSTLWLIHWNLAALPEKTTWFWAFNYFPTVTFDRDQFQRRLAKVAEDQLWSRVAGSTIKSDVACFVRTYVAQHVGQSGHDDALESPLTELGLIKAIGKRDGFRFARGPKSTLGDGVFAYALMDFWSRFTSAATLSFEAIAHEPGAPGRVFLLDENDVADRLASLDEVTGGLLRWSETAGLKQVVRENEFKPEDSLGLLSQDYGRSTERKAA